MCIKALLVGSLLVFAAELLLSHKSVPRKTLVALNTFKP